MTHTIDLGNGWYVSRWPVSSWIEWVAAKLDAPGGYVVDGLRRRFGTRREAVAWVREQQRMGVV